MFGNNNRLIFWKNFLFLFRYILLLYRNACVSEVLINRTLQQFNLLKYYYFEETCKKVLSSTVIILIKFSTTKLEPCILSTYMNLRVLINGFCVSISSILHSVCTSTANTDIRTTLVACFRSFYLQLPDDKNLFVIWKELH